MKSLVDLLPLVAFFGGFFLKDMQFATLALVVGLAVQIVVYVIFKWEITKQMYAFLGIGVAMAALTLWLQDPIFIKLRPTLISIVVVTVLTANLYLGKKLFVESLVGSALILPQRAWRGITIIIIGVMFFNLLLNAWIAYYQTEDFWVYYRLIKAVANPIILVAACWWYIKAKKYKVEFKADKDTTPVVDRS